MFSLADLTGNDLVWLLDLNFAGEDLALARDFESYVDDDGAATIYHPGLEWGGTLDDAIDLLGDAPSPRQVALTLHLGDLLNVPELVAAGHDLAAVTGKLWIWARGTSERLLLVDGRITDPQYGARHEPVTLTLEEVPLEDFARIPPALARVDSTTWPSAADDVEDEFYPMIFGRPGFEGDARYGSPGLWVANDKLLIAGHSGVNGGDVYVWNITDASTAGASGQLAVAHETDGRGRRVMTVDIHTLSHTDDTDEYWIQWLAGEASGMADHDGSDLNGAGSLLRYMLEQSDVRWDRGRIAAIVDTLNLFQIDCAITASPGQRFSPLAWVQQHLLPILPISARQGPEGLYYSLFRYDATAAQAIASVNVDALDAVRDSAISYSSTDQIANEFRLSYRPNAKDNKASATHVLTGDDDTLATDDDAVSNAPCRVSRQRYGLRVMELRTDVVYDAATAGRICGWLSHAFALPARIFSYTATQRFAHLEPGDIVTLTDSEVSASQVVCLVDSVQWTAQDQIGLTLRSIDNPARDSY